MAVGVVGFSITLALRLAGVSPSHIRKSPGAISVIAVVAQAVLDLGLLAYLAANIRLRFHSPFWRTIGWRPIETRSVSRTFPYFGSCAWWIFAGRDRGFRGGAVSAEACAADPGDDRRIRMRRCFFC